MDSYKKEITALHERNIQSAINEKTASMKVRLETLNQDNIRLNQDLQSSKSHYIKDHHCIYTGIVHRICFGTGSLIS